MNKRLLAGTTPEVAMTRLEQGENDLYVDFQALYSLIYISPRLIAGAPDKLHGNR